MEKRVVMAESMLEATLQYNSGQVKPQVPPGYMHFLLLFGTIFNYKLICLELYSLTMNYWVNGDSHLKCIELH